MILVVSSSLRYVYEGDFSVVLEGVTAPASSSSAPLGNVFDYMRAFEYFPRLC